MTGTVAQREAVTGGERGRQRRRGRCHYHAAGHVDRGLSKRLLQVASIEEGVLNATRGGNAGGGSNTGGIFEHGA